MKPIGVMLLLAPKMSASCRKPARRRHFHSWWLWDRAWSNKNNLLCLGWTSPFALSCILNCSVEGDVWGGFKSCDFSGPALVKLKKKLDECFGLWHARCRQCSFSLSGQYISHNGPCWCRSPWINVLWVSQPHPACPIRGERLNTQDLARGLKPSSGFVARCCSNESGGCQSVREVTSLKVNPKCFAAIFSACFRAASGKQPE